MHRTPSRACGLRTNVTKIQREVHTLPYGKGYFHTSTFAPTARAPATANFTLDGVDANSFGGNMIEATNNSGAGQAIHRDGSFVIPSLVGISEAWREVLTRATRVPATETTACLQGRRAARQLGISRMQLYGRLRKFGIEDA